MTSFTHKNSKPQRGSNQYSYVFLTQTLKFPVFFIAHLGFLYLSPSSPGELKARVLKVFAASSAWGWRCRFGPKNPSRTNPGGFTNIFRSVGTIGHAAGVRKCGGLIGGNLLRKKLPLSSRLYFSMTTLRSAYNKSSGDMRTQRTHTDLVGFDPPKWFHSQPP